MRMSRLGLLVSAALLPLVLWAALPVLSSGASLSSRIEQKRRQIEHKKGRERVLSGTVARWSHRIGALQGDITVLLESDGFADLLERTEFMERVSDQDARIIDRVRTARADAKRTAERLDALEKRQTKVAAAIEARRDEVSRVRGQLVDRRDQFAAVRSDKAGALAST